MNRDSCISVQCIGIGIYKITVFGESTISSTRNSSAEITLNEDDLENLLYDISQARRRKVIIS